jgi:CheY-like chemotaxis protein
LDLLQPLGFEVVLAENGQAGVQRARETMPDLILMDLVMPVMMGFEAVAAIRASPSEDVSPALAKIPIIAVSASAHDMDQDKSRAVGCDDFLPKPVEAEKLLELLQQHLNLVWLCDDAAPPDELREPLLEEAQLSAELTPPPQDELEALYELARFGNMERIRARAHDLENLSEQYRPFARELRRLANAFDDEQIQKLVKHYLITTG